MYHNQRTTTLTLSLRKSTIYRSKTTNSNGTSRILMILTNVSSFKLLFSFQCSVFNNPNLVAPRPLLLKTTKCSLTNNQNLVHDRVGCLSKTSYSKPSVHDMDEIGLVGLFICFSTLSSHCRGPCSSISNQHGVPVTSCRW